MAVVVLLASRILLFPGDNETFRSPINENYLRYMGLLSELDFGNIKCRGHKEATTMHQIYPENFPVYKQESLLWPNTAHSSNLMSLYASECVTETIFVSMVQQL